jgi:glutamine amidotransferase-like uncharacterized protein
MMIFGRRFRFEELSEELWATILSLLGIFGVATLSLLSGCAYPLSDSNFQSGVPPIRGDAKVLLLSGSGTWPAEIVSLEKILKEHGIQSRQATSQQLENLDLNSIASYSLLVVPGGNAITLTAELSKKTRLNIRTAVRDRGMSYLGFCAGAWMAISPDGTATDAPTYGFGLIDGPLQQEAAYQRSGSAYTLADAIFPGGIQRRLLWWGGPITPEGDGTVIARYPDGGAAISQIPVGRGWAILSGLHPAATPEVFEALGLDPATPTSLDYAWTLLQSALTKTALPTVPTPEAP